MKKLLFLIIVAGVIYLLWGNVDMKGVKEKAQESEQVISEKAQKLKGEISK